MKGSLYMLIYTAALGVICASLLTAASEVLAPYREANRKAEQVHNILRVLAVPLAEHVTAQEMVKAFDENVRLEKRGKLSLYVYAPSKGPVQAVAVPFAGQGLWGPIKGYLALEPDLKTIRAVTFAEQEETPGLGGEIGSLWFRSQFTGKSIVGPQGRAGIEIRKGGAALADNEVAAITGATLTCNRLEIILNDVIQQITEIKHDGQ